MGRSATILTRRVPVSAGKPESFYRAAPNYCRDTAVTGMLHPGKRCYREISQHQNCGCGPGNQVCFDNSGTIEYSPDRISPVNGMTADGWCVVDPVCGPMHILTDVMGLDRSLGKPVTPRIAVSPQMGALYSGQMGGSVAQYQSAAANPYVRAFLDTIAWAEGADYNTLYGGNTFSSYAQHPLAIGAIPVGSTTTSAAGRYQFERGTWNDAQRSLGLSDFSPANQDLAAIYLIDGRGQLSKLMAGDIDGTLRGLGCLWASLPFSDLHGPCSGRKQDYNALLRYYNGALAVYSAGGAPLASTTQNSVGSGAGLLALLFLVYLALS